MKFNNNRTAHTPLTPEPPHHSAAVQEIERFMESPEFQAALQADEKIFGPKGVAQIREAISDVFKIPKPGDLLRKWIGEMHQLGQRGQDGKKISANSPTANRNPSPGATPGKGHNTPHNIPEDSGDMRKSTTRKVMLSFLARLSADPRFHENKNPARPGKAAPIEVNLDENLQRIKSQAKGLVKGRRTKEALSLLRETYRKNQRARRNIGFIGYIANLYYKTRQYTEALFFAEKLLALDQTDLIALSIAENSAQKLKKWPEALKYAEKFLEFLPENTIALGIATYAAFQMGKDAEALEYSRRYLELSHRDAEKLQIATFSAFHLKRYQEAIEYARRYYLDTSLPYDKDIVHIIAECAFELGLMDNTKSRNVSPRFL